MLDRLLRSPKDHALRPITAALAPWIAPIVLTGVSLFAGILSGLLAAAGLTWWALGWWWVSRIADGLDGPVARARGQSSDLGGYLDILGDTVVYVAIPLGVAIGVGDDRVWIATAVLLATFYVNAVSWLFIAAVIEKRAAATTSGRTKMGTTTIVMPSGLVEGTETIVAFSLLLAFPGHAVLWCCAMALLVGLTVLQRVAWARRHLG